MDGIRFPLLWMTPIIIIIFVLFLFILVVLIFSVVVAYLMYDALLPRRCVRNGRRHVLQAYLGLVMQVDIDWRHIDPQGLCGALNL